MDVDKMEAGRELDALIAEKVMGCKVERHEHPSGSPDHPPIVHWECRCEEVPAHYHAACTPFPFKHGRYEGCREIKQYSERIAAAWEALTAAIPRINRGGSIVFTNHYPDLYGIDVRFDGLEAINADEAPLAICRALLKAVSST